MNRGIVNANNIRKERVAATNWVVMIRYSNVLMPIDTSCDGAMSNRIVCRSGDLVVKLECEKVEKRNTSILFLFQGAPSTRMQGKYVFN